MDRDTRRSYVNGTMERMGRAARTEQTDHNTARRSLLWRRDPGEQGRYRRDIAIRCEDAHRKLFLADAEPRFAWSFLRGRGCACGFSHNLDGLTGHARQSRYFRQIPWAASRESPADLCRGFGLLRHEWPRRCRRGCRNFITSG